MGSILAVCCLRNSNDQANPQYGMEHRPSRRVNKDAIKRILTFKDFKGFKKIKDINDYYTFFGTLGQGSFGKVERAEHIKASVDCAVKIIEKKKVREHKILEDLMHNELKVLEETVS